jgi:hypothetical protein
MLAEQLAVAAPYESREHSGSCRPGSSRLRLSRVLRLFDLSRVAPLACLATAVLCLLWLDGSSMAQSQHLSLAWQQKTFASAFAKQRTMPRVDHGYLLSFRHRIFENDESNLFVRSMDTGEEQATAFWIKGASEIRAEDVAANSKGQIYVAGSMMRPGQVTLTNFVAEVDRSGNPPRVFDLGSFTPKRVCGANDGTIWAFGLTLGGHGEDGHGERLLRQYSSDGALLNAYLPDKKFPTLASRGFRRAAVTLTCGDESVGVYLARPARWIEVQSGKPVAYKWRIQSPPPGIVTGAVLVGSHEVYATFATRTLGADGKVNVSSTLYKLNLPIDGQIPSLSQSSPASFVDTSRVGSLPSGDRPRGIWTQLVDPSDSRSGNIFLLGRDAQSLVYVGRKAESSDSTLYWVRP